MQIIKKIKKLNDDEISKTNIKEILNNKMLFIGALLIYTIKENLIRKCQIV